MVVVVVLMCGCFWFVVVYAVVLLVACLVYWLVA